jgi:predicted metalloendopeptidase
MSYMNAEQIKFYESEVKGFAEMYFKKDASVSMLNDKLRQSIRKVWIDDLKQTRADFGCATCIDTMLRHSYAIYKSSKADLLQRMKKEEAEKATEPKEEIKPYVNPHSKKETSKENLQVANSSEIPNSSKQKRGKKKSIG